MPGNHLNGRIRGAAESCVARDNAAIMMRLLPGAEHEETHLSHVFLTEDEVFKLKKPVHLPFADFSTIGKRHAACAEELEVNRESGGALYRDIVPLTERSGAHAIDGEGTPIDWLVRMRRFRAEDRGDRAMASGRVTAAMLRDFTDELYRRHEATPKAAITSWSDVLQATLKNMAAALLNKRLPGEGADRASQWSADLAKAMTNHKACLEARTGFVLESTHGDLHLKNLCLFEGALIAYDALEFDRDLVRIDPLYDLAFLIADLWHRGHGTAANAVMNRYLGLAGSYEAAILIPLYASLRCGIRALAEAMSHHAEEAKAYLISAQCFLAEADRITILIAGRSGTGKSTLAAEIAADFAPPPGAVHLRSDILRKRMNVMWPEQSLGKTAYTPWARDDLYKRYLGIAASLSGRVPLILDIALASSPGVPEIEKLATSKLWLTAPDIVLAGRLDLRQADASDADKVVMATQRSQPPGDGWTLIDASGSSRETAAIARGFLADTREPGEELIYDPHHEV